ncbi:Transposon Tf2-2 polyprotein [Senna tora]|uniref:Transposon Tf2-2 polyprotein n=1 Tax=Senna tora TaxID=362788 RepID=A0A834W3B6_9FABA|nr:Transposon Tf2-2 polyprotein [Senna tora]
MHGPTEREAKIKAKSISVMQLAKGVKKAQPTYVAAMKEEEDPLSGSVPEKVQKLLEKFVDDGHHVAYESRKLTDVERQYTVQEKEMTVVVQCLKTWRHHLLGSMFVVKTDNVATSYFLHQKKLTPKQARWQDFLAEFDFVMVYKPGKANFVADALSRKAELAAITSPTFPLVDRIKEGLEHDPQAKSLMELASQGKTRRFWLEDGVLVTKGSRTYIPKWQGLRREIIKECHDSKWAGHPGVRRTLALVERAYYWPQMRDDIELFWMELFKILGSELNFSTSFHPQTDGQTERLNALLELFLRHYSTGASPFEIVIGQQPMTPHTLAVGYTGPSPSPSNLTVCQIAQGTSKTMHPVFHVSLLKPYHKDMQDPSRGETRRAPTAITEVPERDVEEILAHRVVPRRGSHSSYVEYLVKWKGDPDSEASWEHELTLWNHKDLIEAYKREATRTSPD